MSNSRNNIVKDVENLMITVIKNEIPKRDKLSSNHTLKTMNFWKGADVAVVQKVQDIPKPDGFYPGDEYIICRSAYEVSWVLCELRDIYEKNNFYDYQLKYTLFGTFADNYMKNYKMIKRVNRQWFEEQDKWMMDKSFILKSLQELIYSYQGSFLPCDCDNADKKTMQPNPLSDVHLGAEG